MRKFALFGDPARCGVMLVTVLLFLAHVPRVFGQQAPSYGASVPGLLAGVPTARSLAYPQSVFVDSRSGNIWVTDFDNNRVLRFDVVSLTGIAGGGGGSGPAEYVLGQNYPNPFNPETTIVFALKNPGHATVKVYTMLGQEVATLFDRMASANVKYSLRFDATNRPSGMYMYVLRSGSRREVRKMCVVK